MKTKDYLAKGCLAIIQDNKTLLYHGAAYRNHPTPSGCDRWAQAFTTIKGYDTIRSAALIINESFPHFDQININQTPNEVDGDIDAKIELLQNGALIVLLTPNSHKTKDEAPFVEVSAFDSIKAPILHIPLTPDQLSTLIRKGLARFTSSSGCDPSLHYRYDHYVFYKDKNTQPPS